MTRTRHLAAVFLLSAALAPAQFQHPVTTGDGARLYFMSTLRQRGTAQHLYPKIFSLDTAGVALVLEPAPPGPSPLDQYWIDLEQTAADGSWLLYGRLRNCIGGSSCFLNEQRSAVLLEGGETRTYGGNARLSRDGRWLVTYSSPNVMLRLFSRTDRRTGERVDLLPAVGSAPARAPTVSAGGAVLVPRFDRLVLWRDGTVRTLAEERVVSAVMDDAAAIAVYEKQGLRLRAVDTATGRQWPVGSDERDNWGPSISADGQYVLYTSRTGGRPQVFFSRTDGSAWRQLTDEPSGASRSVLSGDGRVAWVLSDDGAILRVDTMTGAIERRVGATPSVTRITPGVPGSAGTIDATGLPEVAEVAAPPLAGELHGVEVRVGGRLLLLHAIVPGRIYFQVPWDMPADAASELMFNFADPAFDTAIPYPVRDVDPRPVPLAPPDANGLEPVAIHEDFGSLVTPANPARPGEIVHLYATGLGPVDRSVPSGMPSPADPPARVTRGFQWRWGAGSDTPADVLFAGLAPGMVGYYQIDARIPDSVSFEYVSLSVRWFPAGDGWYEIGMGLVPVRRNAP